jgi:hypothetical protein
LLAVFVSVLVVFVSVAGAAAAGVDLAGAAAWLSPNHSLTPL